MRRIDKNFVGQGEQLAVQAVIKHSCQLCGVETLGKIGTAHVSEEKRIAGENSPGRGRLLFVRNYQANAFGRMAGGFKSCDAHFSNLHMETVLDSNVREGRLGLRSDVNASAGSRRQLSVSGDKVGMQVSFEDVANGDMILLSGFEV